MRHCEHTFGGSNTFGSVGAMLNVPCRVVYYEKGCRHGAAECRGQGSLAERVFIRPKHRVAAWRARRPALRRLNPR